jgi:hypothetical protein
MKTSTAKTPRRSWRPPQGLPLATEDLNGGLQPVRQRDGGAAPATPRQRPEDAKKPAVRRLLFSAFPAFPRPASFLASLASWW